MRGFPKLLSEGPFEFTQILILTSPSSWVNITALFPFSRKPCKQSFQCCIYSQLNLTDSMNVNQEQASSQGLLSMLEVPQFDAVKGRPGLLVMAHQVRWRVARLKASRCWGCVCLWIMKEGHLWPLVMLCSCPAVWAPRLGRTLRSSALQLPVKWTMIGSTLQGCSC